MGKSKPMKCCDIANIDDMDTFVVLQIFLAVMLLMLAMLMMVFSKSIADMLAQKKCMP